MKALLLALTTLLLACTNTPAVPPASTPTFTQGTFTDYLQHLQAKAQAQGHNPALLTQAFGQAKPTPVASILKAHANQPETTRTFHTYTGPMLKQARVNEAKAKLRAGGQTLQNIAAKYNIPASVIVSLWAIESNFGKNQGAHPIIPALITLGYKGDRRAFWEAELMAALTIIEKENLHPTELKGSWAGAMGQIQFMPRTFLAHAADGDADGHINIWTNQADSWASIANYLQHLGFNATQPWRHPLSNKLDLTGVSINQRGLSEPLTLQKWVLKGLSRPTKELWRPTYNTPLFRHYQPQPSGPAYLLGPNFQALLRWNNSSYFAYSVLTLADMIKG